MVSKCNHKLQVICYHVHYGNLLRIWKIVIDLLVVDQKDKEEVSTLKDTIKYTVVVKSLAKGKKTEL